MEAIHSYRHVVGSDIINIFKDSLKEAISRKKLINIGFLGLITNFEKKEHHDIDLIIFPAENAKIGETLIELNDFYKEVEKIIQKYHERYYLVTASKKALQELVYYISGIEEGSAGLIPVHSLFFPDYKSFKRINPVSFEKEIKKHLLPLYGSFDIIHKVRNDISQEKLEPYFVIVDFEMSARIKNFPKHNIRASAESLFSYLREKYDIKVKEKPIHNISEIEKEFIRLMKLLDKRTYKN